MDFHIASSDCLKVLAATVPYCAADLARLERFITRYLNGFVDCRWLGSDSSLHHLFMGL